MKQGSLHSAIGRSFFFFFFFFFFNKGAQKYNNACVGSLMVSYTARITEYNRLLLCGQV